MKANRDEVIPLLDQRIKEKRLGALQLLEQAAVDKQHLTNDPKWDVFLQEIQSQMNEAKKEREGLEMKFRDVRLVMPEQKQIIQQQIIALTAAIETFENVIALPSRIIEDGEKAREALSQA